jgi:hypothetical protein
VFWIPKMRIFILLYICQIYKWDSIVPAIWMASSAGEQFHLSEGTEENDTHLLSSLFLHLVWDLLTLPSLWYVDWHFLRTLGFKSESRGTHFSWSCLLFSSSSLFQTHFWEEMPMCCLPCPLLIFYHFGCHVSRYHAVWLLFPESLTSPHATNSSTHLVTRVLFHYISLTSSPN